MTSAAPLRAVARTLTIQSCTAALSLAAGIIVARAVGADGKGVHALAVLTSSLGVLVLAGALPAAIVHHASVGFISRTRLAGHITSAVLVVAIITVPPAIAAVMLNDGSIAGIPLALLGLTLLAVPTEIAITLIGALLQGTERLTQANMLLLLRTLLLASWTLVLVVLAGRGLAGAVAAIPLGGATALIVAAAIGSSSLSEWRPRWEQRTWAAILDFAKRGYLANLSQFLSYRIDLFILEAARSLTHVGLYSVSSRFAELLWQLPNAVGYVLLPGVARLKPDQLRSQVNRAFSFTVLVTALTAIALAVVAPWLVPGLYGSNFEAAVPALWLLLPGAVAMAGTKILGNVLAGRGRPELASRVSAGSLGATMALDLLLIPWLGVAGAALATSMSYAITLALAWRAYRRLLSERG